MRIKGILLLTVSLAVSIWPAAFAGEKPAGADSRTQSSAETKARADHAAAEKSAREAEAAVLPLRAAMQQADTAYANASKAAIAKRQQATDAKNLAGTQGVEERKRAEANVPAAIKVLRDAVSAKPPLDKAFADAKAAALPLQQAYDAAEKAAKEAEARARTALDAASKLDDEAKKSAAQAVALRRVADTAKATLARARQKEQQSLAQAKTAQQKLTEAQTQKDVAGTALAHAQRLVAVAEGNLSKEGDAAKASLAQAKTAQQNVKNLATAATQKLVRVSARKKLADAALASLRTQIAAAAKAAQAAESTAQAAAKSAEEKQRLAAQAAARRNAAMQAAAALAEAQQRQQQAQALAADAAQKWTEAQAQKKLADEAARTAKNQVAGAKLKAADVVKAALAQSQQGEQAAQGRATAATRRGAETEAQKKVADAALASAQNQVAAALSANQQAQNAAAELLKLDAASKQAAADAAARRKAADASRAALAPAQQKLEQAAIQANNATQELARSEARKKSAEEALTNLKQRIAAAIQTHVADDQAAKKAEDQAAPLKVEAEKTRAAYAASLEVADTRRALAERAKAALYRLQAASQVAQLMESADPPRSVNRIDEIVFAKLKTLRIQPALCSDPVFIRRAFLDLTGKLPSAAEVKNFIRDAGANKRIVLIDRLLERPEHVDYWAMKWSDILRVKAEFPVKIWPNAAQAYYHWIWESIARNKPYDQFVRELLTSSGSNFRVGQVNFYRAIQNRTPEGIAGAVGLTFLGARIHLWPEDRRSSMTVFFSQVGYKPTSEWKEEIVFWDPLKSVAVPGSIAPGVDDVARSVTATNQVPQSLGQPLAENGPLAVVFPDGSKATIPPNRDPREAFADWLIRPENPWFAKALVNRTWGWALGRGIVHEPDDIRQDNPPSNPELLAYLEKEFVSSGYNLKHLKRLIFSSTTYQFSPIPRSRGPEAVASFASYLLRRVEAEVLIDAINEITGSSDLYTSAVPEPFTYIPGDVHAVALADGSITSSFLTMFGRSARATGLEAERVSELASTQWLHMLNSATIQSKLQNGPRLAAMVSAGGSPREIAERLYLTILSRFPTDADVRAVEAYAKTGVTQGRDVWLDLAWALINSPEFLLRH